MANNHNMLLALALLAMLLSGEVPCARADGDWEDLDDDGDVEGLLLIASPTMEGGAHAPDQYALQVEGKGIFPLLAPGYNAADDDFLRGPDGEPLKDSQRVRVRGHRVRKQGRPGSAAADAARGRGRRWEAGDKDADASANATLDDSYDGAPVSFLLSGVVSAGGSSISLDANIVTASQSITRMGTLFLVATFCGNTAAASTLTDVTNTVFNNVPSVSSILNGCSNNANMLNTANSRVVAVNVPCSGNVLVEGSLVAYKTSGCGWPEVRGLLWAARAAAAAQGVPVDGYNHWVLVLPNNHACPWIGMGLQGRNGLGVGEAWVTTSIARQPASYIHELGHNNWLNHATTPAGMVANPRNEYLDYTSIMGYCCSSRCHAAPDSWLLGWAKPIAWFDKNNMIAGQRYQITLERFTRPGFQQQFVGITSNWAGGTGLRYFLSFRSAYASKYDYISTADSGLVIHSWSGTSQRSLTLTINNGALRSNLSTWASDTSPSAFVVRLETFIPASISSQPQRITFSVCRRGAPECL